MAKQQPSPMTPVIRFAPLGELKVYAVTEAELDELERGSPASIHLNFALFFWGTAASLFVTIRTVSFAADRAFYVFLVAFAATVIAALVFSVLWFVQHRSAKSLIKRIRNRMPPPTGIQEPVPPAPQISVDLSAQRDKKPPQLPP